MLQVQGIENLLVGEFKSAWVLQDISVHTSNQVLNQLKNLHSDVARGLRVVQDILDLHHNADDHLIHIESLDVCLDGLLSRGLDGIDVIRFNGILLGLLLPRGERLHELLDDLNDRAPDIFIVFAEVLDQRRLLLVPHEEVLFVNHHHHLCLRLQECFDDLDTSFSDSPAQIIKHIIIIKFII